MAQYVYTMHRLSKVVPPKREILKNISLSFFPGAKIGVLGLNGAGKSTLLRIMAGVDTEFDGEARPMPGINVGYLPQEPQLDPSKTVREVVEEAVSQIKDAQARLDQVYAAYAEPDADFDALAAEQAKLFSVQASDLDTPPPDGMTAMVARSTLELMLTQSVRLQGLNEELREARQALDERKQVERAKQQLMRQQGCSEGEAYGRLRQAAMNQGLRLEEVAQRLLALDGSANTAARGQRCRH